MISKCCGEHVLLEHFEGRDLLICSQCKLKVGGSKMIKLGWAWCMASVTIIPFVFWVGGCNFERGPWTMMCAVCVLASTLFGAVVFRD